MADFAYGFRQNTNYVITSNTMYEIGRNYRFSTSAPNQTAGSNNQWVAVSASQAGSSGGQSSLALQSNGTLWSWGNNSYGQLGNNSATNISSPIQVGALSLWSQISSGYYSTLAIQSNGTLWAWGNNAFGQLGLNTSTYYSSPVQVGALSNWATVLISSFSGLSIVSNGSLYAWGTNGFGQLGQNDTVNRSSPVQVALAGPYNQIGVGLGNGYAIKNDGTLWAIGRGVFGTLGTGSTTDASSLVQVGSSSLWTNVSGSRLGVLAIQTPGTLWAWGNNASGSLGLNTSGGTFSTPVQVGALSNWTRAAGGNDFSLALKNDGTLWSWGTNGNGQLGLNTNGGTFSTPVQVGALTTWTRISAGNAHSGFIQSNGTLWMCGYNVTGQLGVNTSTTRISSPVQVGTLSVWTQISCGSGPGNLYGFSMAVQSNGTLWAWGNDGYGQLGLNTSANYSSPVQVGALSTWTNILCGYYNALAVQNNGTLWTWGNNSYGQLGNNTTTLSIVSSPVQVGGLGNSALPTGYITQWTWASSSNQLYAWGRNQFGQLGQNSTSVPSASSPLQIVPTTYLTATKIASSYYSNYAIQSPGTLWAWGRNDQGQLGQGNTTDRLGAVQIGALNYWTQISAGGVNGQVAAILSPGTLWAWGYNAQGQLGLNTTTTSYSSPVQVGVLSLWTQVACGYSHTAAIQTPGTLWAWGTNSYGQLGNNSASSNVLSPIQIGTASNWSRVSCGYQFTVALQSNGTLWTWGLNSYSQLGYNTTSYRSSATQIGTVGVWTGFPTGSQNSFWGAAINSNNNLYVWGNNSNRILNSNYYITDTTDTVASCAIIANPVPLDPTLSSPIRSASIGDQFGVYVQSNGTLWSWGNNSFGQTTNFSLSTGNQLVPSATYMNTWKQISCGYYYCIGIQNNGTLWSFGANSLGQLGINTTPTIGVSSPIQIGNLNTWTQISCGYQSAAAIQSNGTLWTWGNDGYGQLAQNNTQSYSSPIQVGALSVWTQVSAGSRHMLGLQSNGTLWAWGTNGQGQLGNNTSTSFSSPIQIGALTSWAKISAGFFNSYAIQSNGTLWAWGLGQSGALGLSDVTNRSSPVQVGTLSTWTKVYGGYFYALAIQSNGTLWSWGQDTYGALGLGDNTNRSSPVQVGALSGWTSISASVYTSSAIQNGALYMMGYNANGQLGQGDLGNRYSPVQVGTASNWVQSAGGYFFSSGLQSTGVWSTWGQNSSGQLGYLATVSPLQISTQSNWSQVCCGLNYGMAVQNTGVLYAWGNNSYGQLGLGDLTHRSSLVQVGLGTNWSRVACGYSHTAALQSNGTLWTWGTNSYGQLGQGNFTNTSTPIQVGTLSRYVTVYAMNFTTLAETQ
jgi:alpha-tubulin suppressor-like RCC1 family protein